MNHHYRIVWNKISNTWVAVSEISKGHGKSASARKRVVAALALLGLSVLSMTSSAVDLPTGAQVTAGAASVQAPTNGALTVTQSSQRAVIKWNSFSIGQGKQVNFALPNAGASSLNIVTSDNASSIAGTLTSNGSVYLINQNGIAITPSGLVDVRTGFIASTLRMDENAFMGGQYLFNGKGGAVVNRGQIITGSGGSVGLLGSTVANEGLISAPLGRVALGSGEAATLDLSGDGFLQVMLPSSAVATDGQALVSNKGVIQADGGVVMLKAATVRQALRDAVNMPGDISARSVSGKTGAIVLGGGGGGSVRVTGTLAADGDTVGGRIDVTGDNVTLEGASLSATGAERGGLVRVGGAFQGGREQPVDPTNVALFAGRFGSTPTLSNATTTTIDAASNINVSATGLAGTGGTAIVWSDKTTVMQGAISARGALAGGAVEVSAKSTVQSVALSRIDLGKGGNLLIDPQDIVIDPSGTDTTQNTNYAAPGTVTHLRDADVTALLSTGVTVSLQASQDITWLNNFSFVTRTPTTPGGNLNLSAGRSVTLTGIFNTADGNWNIVGNDTAAHGVVDAQRGAGAAEINVSNANFINSNGNFSLTLADGLGNTNREASGISLGKFNGNGLTAAISTTAVPASGTTRILLTDSINVSSSINLTGNLRVSSSSPVLLLSGSNVTWSDEKSGATLQGEGGIKFVENGVVKRLGTLSFSDAVRLELGGDNVTRTYGEADPTMVDLLTPQLHVASHSPAAAPDSLMTILSADSLAVSGPGRYASVGQNTLTVTSTSTAAFSGGLQGGYFVDLTAATTPLTITRRSVVPTVSNGAYTYGSPAKVVTLGNVVNGDLLVPVATLNGSPNVGMSVNGTGYGFGETLAAGSSAFTLSSLAGSQANNYFLDMSGPVAGALEIARKPLNYVAQGGSHVYGSPNGLPLGTLSGIVAQDVVTPQIGLLAAGASAVFATKLAVGTYTASVVSLGGAEAGNYTIATSGNTDGQYQVTPKTLSYAVANASSTYGTPASLGSSVLSGVLAGDAVTAVASLKDAADNIVSQSSTLAAGNYREIVSILSGTASSNYQLATSGNQEGTLAIARKQITYTGSDSTQTYGTGALPTPALNGVVGTDHVTAQQSVTTVQSQQQGGSGAVAVGEYKVDVASLTGAESANYTVAPAGSGSTSGHVLVTPKFLSYTLAPSSSITYGNAAPYVPFSGIVIGDLIQGMSSVASAGVAQALVSTTDVGSYVRSIVGLSGTGAGNYVLASSGNINGNLTITPRSLNWQVDSGSAVYGDAITNLVNLNLGPGDTVNAGLSILDASGAALARPGVGSYSVGVNTISGPRATNYVLASAGNSPGTVQITPRPINYRVTDTASQYGEAVNAFGSQSVELFRILPEDINQVHAVTGAGYLIDAKGGYHFAGSWVPAGTYSRSSFNILGLDNKNYMLGINYSMPGNYGFHDVLKSPVYSSGTQTKSITYGDVYDPIRANLVGILPHDSLGDGVYANLDGNLSAQLMVAGDHVVTVGTLQGYAAANYYYANQPGAPLIVTVKKKPVYLQYNQGGNEPKYFGNPLTTNYVAYGVISDIAGLQSGQTPVTVNGLVPGGETGLLVQPQNPVFQLSSSGALNVGNYAWTPASFSSSNYVVVNPGVGAKYLTITPKQITSDLAYTSLENRTPIYGETLGMLPPVHAVWATNTIRLGDSIDVSFSFSNLPQGQGALSERQSAGKYQIYPSDVTGRDAANYQVTYTKPSDGLYLTILPRSVDARIASTSFTYGNQITVPAPVLNALPGDSVSSTTVVSGFGGTATDFEFQQEGYHRNAGTYYLKLGPLTGPSAANYKIGGQQDSSARQSNRPPDELALLSIEQRQLQLAGSRQNFTITYGENIAAPSLFITGVLPGDFVDKTPQILPASGGVLLDLGQRLPAGEYSLQFPLTGISSKNYRRPVDQFQQTIPNFGTISVAKREVTVTNLTSEYGTTPKWTPVFNNVLAGDDLSSTAFGVQKENTSILGPVPTGLLDVGRYTMAPSASNNFGEAVLSGPGSRNYVFRTASYNVSITPKLLLWTPNSNLTSTYGDAIDMGTLTGFFEGDVFNNNFPGVTYVKPPELLPGTPTGYSSIQLKSNAPVEVNVLNTPFNSVVPVRSLGKGYTQVMAASFSPLQGIESGVKITFSGYARLGGQYESSRNLNEQQSLSEVKTYDRPINAGTYDVFVPGSTVLTGVHAGNYQLPANMQGTQWVVKPRVINYSVGNTTRQYGNYEGCSNYQCPFSVPATKLGSVSYSNVLRADDLFQFKTIDAVIENIGLIAATGEKGTSALITSNTPVGTTYIQVLDSINDNNYVLAKSGNQAGLLQIVPKFLTYSTSSAFYMPGIGLVGTPGTTTVNGINGGEQVTPVVSITDPQGRANADLKTLIAGRYYFRVVGFTGRDAGNYQVMPLVSNYEQNDIGSLDVFADTRLGMNFIPTVNLPASLPILPIVVHPTLPVNDKNMTFPRVDDTTDSRGIRSAETTTTSTITTTSVSATADVGATTDTGTTVGGVTIGAGASGNANAGCNVAGCTAGVSGNANTSVELSADDKLKLEADAYAKVKAGLSMSGVEVSATTVAQVAVEVGGSRNVSGAGAVNYGVIAAAVSGAQAKGVASWNDGFTFTTGAQVGVGVSAGATAGISGSVGSASVGPSIYSPGSFGGQFSFSPGYSDGTLSVSMNLGAQIGLGGLNLNINLSLNLKPISDAFSDHRSQGEKERDHAYDLGEQGDHLGQIAYLQDNYSWRETYGTDQLNDTLNRYNAVLVKMTEAKQYELDKQSYVLNLMRTDPTAALAYVRQENFLGDNIWIGFQRKERELNNDISQLGLKLGVNNAQLTLSNGP